MAVLALLIGVSALPAAAAAAWVWRRALPLGPRGEAGVRGLPWILLAFLGGALALAAAALAQSLWVIREEPNWTFLLVKTFGFVAASEEVSRLVTLALLFRAAGLHRRKNAAEGTALGLLAGLGFAVIETAVYGAADFRVTLLRAVTAAPLHGACGARLGTALAGPFRSGVLSRLVYVTVIHGTYDLLLVSPGIAPFFAALLAFTALAAALQPLKRGNF